MESPKLAIEVNAQLFELLSREDRPQLYMMARLNFALCLLAAGRAFDARDVVVYGEDLYSAHSDAYARTCLSWTAGRVAAAMESSAEAEEKFLSVQDFSVRRSHGFDCALVSLDLAEIYRRQGRWREVRDRASEAAHLFQDLGIFGEERTARDLLAEALRH